MVSFFLRKSVVTICLNFVILLIGALSLKDIAREFIPSVEIPAVAVVFPITVQRPAVFASEFLEPLEQQFLVSGDVHRVESTVSGGRSISIVYFKWDLTPEQSLQRARQIVARFHRPPGVLEPIFVLHRPSLSPVFRVALHGAHAARLTELTEGTVRALERLPGVAEVRRLGAATEITRLEVDAKKSARSGVPLLEIVRAATEEWSFRQLWPQESGPATLVRVRYSGPGSDSEGAELGLMPVQPPGGAPGIEVRQIADIRETTAPASVYYGKGEEAVIVEILKAAGSDTVRMLSEAKARIDELTRQHPEVKATIVYDESKEIVESQSGVLSNFAQGIVLNSIILILFLGSFRGVFIASAIFPTSVIGTLFIMKQLGVSLNIFSLNGFSLAAGMITDASTVVLESVLRRIQLGDDVRDGTIRGTSDVMIGVVSGTCASAAVLIPICLQTGVSAKLFSDLGIALIGTQVLTLISVFSLVPFLCSRLLKPDMKPARVVAHAYAASSALVRVTSGLAIQSLERTRENTFVRWALPSGFAFVCVGSLFFLPNSELLPTVGSRIYLVSIPIERPRLQEKGGELAVRLSRAMGSEIDFEWTLVNRDEDSLKGTLAAKAKASIDFTALGIRLATAVGVPATRVHFFPLGPTPPSEAMNYDGSVAISHALDPARRRQLIDRICSVRGISDCSGPEHFSGPTINLDADSIFMQRAHTNPLSTALELSLRINEVDLASAANLNVAKPLVMNAKDEALVSSGPYSPSANGAGAGKQVTSISSFYRGTVMNASQVRFSADRRPYDPLFFKISGITIGQAASAIESTLKDLSLPLKSLEPMGSMANMSETFSKVQSALVISLVLNFGILLLQFRSVVQTILIMTTIPLALGGSVVGLLLMKETVNVGVLVGFMLLGGIVVNNGILLLESFGQAREQGLGFDEAMSEAIRTRTRPILMTAFSTIFGMMPTLLDGGSGAELYRGMAIVNIFGMAVGTVLSLIVLPALCRLTMTKEVTT